MNYSSRAGHDLINNAVYVETVLSDEFAEKFYDNYTLFNFIDFGAGVYGISVDDILDKYDSAVKLASFLETSEENAQQVFDELQRAVNSRAYTV